MAAPLFGPRCNPAPDLTYKGAENMGIYYIRII